MRDIYLISGLGADRRVFQFLNFGDLRIHHIDWVDPGKDESLQDYVRRLCKQITRPRPILLGVSFGGMIAIEIGKLIETDKIVIISSAKSRDDFPRLRRMGWLKILAVLPATILKTPNEVVYWFFGARLRSEKKLLKAIMKDADVRFLRWALGKVFSWQNRVRLPNVVSIHGTKDRLIPYTRADYVIQNGGHLMIINRSAEIERIINTVLA